MKLFDKDTPQEWLDVLAQVKTVFPDAILAGGCLRDLMLSGKVHDLNIFVSSAAGLNLSSLDDLTQSLGWSNGAAHQTRDYEDGTLAKLGAVFSYIVSNCPEVQIIVLDQTAPLTTFSLIKDFDFSICQVATDGHEVAFTLDFLTDITTRTFRLLRTDRIARSRVRAQRFKDRYGDSVIIDMSADINSGLEDMFA